MGPSSMKTNLQTLYAALRCSAVNARTLEGQSWQIEREWRAIPVPQFRALSTSDTPVASPLKIF